MRACAYFSGSGHDVELKLTAVFLSKRMKHASSAKFTNNLLLIIASAETYIIIWVSKLAQFDTVDVCSSPESAVLVAKTA